MRGVIIYALLAVFLPAVGGCERNRNAERGDRTPGEQAEPEGLPSTFPAEPDTPLEDLLPTSREEPVLPVVRGETSVPLAAVYVRGGDRLPPQGSPPPPSLHVIQLVYSDGRVIVSADAINGGPPYSVGGVSAERVAQLAAALAELSRRCPNDVIAFGPDSAYSTIATRVGRERLVMSSWHELFEQNATLIVDEHGVRVRDESEDRAAPSSRAAAYAAFRTCWSDAREALTAIIPENRTPLGDIEFDLRPATECAGLHAARRADAQGDRFRVRIDEVSPPTKGATE